MTQAVPRILFCELALSPPVDGVLLSSSLSFSLRFFPVPEPLSHCFASLRCLRSLILTHFHSQSHSARFIRSRFLLCLGHYHCHRTFLAFFSLALPRSLALSIHFRMLSRASTRPLHFQSSSASVPSFKLLEFPHSSESSEPLQGSSGMCINTTPSREHVHRSPPSTTVVNKFTKASPSPACMVMAISKWKKMQRPTKPALSISSFCVFRRCTDWQLFSPSTSPRADVTHLQRSSSPSSL